MDDFLYLYPAFYRKNGELNIKNITNRKEIMKNYYRLFQKKKLKLLALDEPMFHELKIKYKKIIKHKNTYLLYHDAATVLKTKNIKSIKNLDLLLKHMGFSKKEYSKVVLSHYVNHYRFSKKIKAKLVKEATNKDKEISYHKLYKLKYNYLKKHNKLIVL